MESQIAQVVSENAIDAVRDRIITAQEELVNAQIKLTNLCAKHGKLVDIIAEKDPTLQADKYNHYKSGELYYL
jgi:hypothetical protein